MLIMVNWASIVIRIKSGESFKNLLDDLETPHTVKLPSEKNLAFSPVVSITATLLWT